MTEDKLITVIEARNSTNVIILIWMSSLRLFFFNFFFDFAIMFSILLWIVFRMIGLRISTDPKSILKQWTVSKSFRSDCPLFFYFLENLTGQR